MIDYNMTKPTIKYLETFGKTHVNKFNYDRLISILVRSARVRRYARGVRSWRVEATVWIALLEARMKAL